MMIFFSNSVFVICNKCIGTNKFFVFLVWGRVPVWWLKSRGGGGGGSLLCGGPPFQIFRIYIKWSLGLKHFCAGGGGVM